MARNNNVKIGMGFLVLMFSSLLVLTSGEENGGMEDILGSTFTESMDFDTMKDLASIALKNHHVRKRAIDSALAYIKPLLPNKESVFAMTARATPSALAAITLYGTFKFAVVVLAAFYCVTTFFPAFFSLFGIPARSLGNIENEIRSITYDKIVARSLDTIKKKSFLLDLEDGSCKDRAICEVGSFISDKFPSVTYWITGLGAADNLVFGDQFTLAMMKGMKNRNSCAHSYPKCKRSPFSTWNEIAEKFR